MKLKHKVTILALATLVTETSHAAITGKSSGFMDKRQLAAWRAEAASNVAVTKQDAPAFFTGKPFLASTDTYSFMFRSYDPTMARWTTEDPSGFPDGANNILYVNNKSTNCVDILGLNIWQITNSNAVAGGGHTAMISGSGTNYQLQSYGSGTSGSASSSSTSGLSTQNFTSSQAALDAAASQGYDRYNQWNTSQGQDSAARTAFSTNANSGPYDVGTHNCADAVTAGLSAAGVEHDSTTNIPNTTHSLNKIYADSFGTLPTE